LPPESSKHGGGCADIHVQFFRPGGSIGSGMMGEMERRRRDFIGRCRGEF
jgi:hypothetical protein